MSTTPPRCRALSDPLRLRRGHTVAHLSAARPLPSPPLPSPAPAGPLRPAQHLPLRTLRQLLLQADTCDCSPARVIARVTGVVPGLHGPTGRPEGAAAPGGAGASAAAITAAVVWPADNLKLQDELAGPLDRGGNGRTYVMGLQLQDATGACAGGAGRRGFSCVCVLGRVLSTCGLSW